MRLLQLQDDGEFSLIQFSDNNLPRYAILSHTWGADNEEVSFQDIRNSTGKSKAGLRKIYFCAKQAKQDGLEYFWVDSCCIDKSSSQELSEAINSMYRWYQNSERCYVYLSDVLNSTSDGDDECTKRWKPAFKKSRWFTRGWTLQELIAPPSVEFFSADEAYLGSKESLEQTVHEISGIAVEALRGNHPSRFTRDERFLWAAKRNTTREEDLAYCLLGVFDVFMPLIYGEGQKNAWTRLEEQIEKTSKNKSFSLDEDQKRMLLDSLRFDQIDARHMTIKNAHAKTCKWLLKKSEYLDWLDIDRLKEHHGFLWIRGKPGTGKSTLMKFALTHARKTMKSEVVIAFFFNARGGDMEKSTIGAYRSLLLQLLERLPALQRVFDSLGISGLGINTNYQWSVESLKILLEQAIKLLGESFVICFIDALDECEEQQIREMIQFFENIGELAVSVGISFRICLSSRHYPHITIRKGLGLVLEGQEGHTQDITNYLESELKIGQSKIAQQIRSELQEKASGVFMWVALVGGILNKEHDRGRTHALRRRLQEIPGDLHELFRDILTRDSHNKSELVLCIQWVLFAKQPLSPEQLYFAILSGVEPDAVSEWDHDEITEDVIKRFILDSSKGLAEITTSKLRRVQFIHESVRDFLLKEDGLGNIWPELRSNLQGQSHERLKHCCLIYISMDVFSSLRITGTLPKANSQEARDLRKLATDMFPFLEYAVQSVLHHADAAEGSGIAQDAFCRKFPLDYWIKLDNLFEKHEVRRHTEGMRLLYVLAERNMVNLIKASPSINFCLEVGEERYGPPLFAAMATGSREAIQVFVEAIHRGQLAEGHMSEIYSQYCGDIGSPNNLGRDFKFSRQRNVLSYLAELGNETILALVLESCKADINSKDKNGWTPLWWAMEKGHEAIVKLLLDISKVNANLMDQSGQTPLMWAAGNGHKAIVKLLLDSDKVDVDSKGHNGKTPLSWAAGNGYQTIVELLLNIGKVDVNSKDYNGKTPLLWALENGHESIATLLLNTGKVNVDSKDQHKRTPLSWAAGNGHQTIVELLLNTGKVEINSKDQNGKTPLLWALENGHEAIAMLLLDSDKVDVDSKDYSGKTSLFWALDNGHENTVTLLLETSKVNVDSKDQHERTPLSWAAGNGYQTIVELLLNTGKVDINSKDQHERTPLSWAAGNGHQTIVELLLNTGKVEINSKDQNRKTPLLWALENEHESIATLLLNTGKVNVDSKDQHERTPLSWAAGNGYQTIVELLLNTGKINVDSKDQHKRTPLSWAAGNGHQTIVELLLNTGKVDVNSKDQNGKIPLSWAARNGHQTVIELLLNIGKVDIDMKDQHERTPLSWAAGNGYQTIVELLLNTGKVNIDSKDYNGKTPLLWALENGHESIATLLLNTGKVNVDSKDQHKRTPLSWAAGNGHQTIVELLLNTGKVDVNSKDQNGKTPLSWAALGETRFGGNYAPAQSRIHVPAHSENHALQDYHLQLMLLEQLNKKRLLIARTMTENENGAIVKLLIETSQVDVNLEDQHGRTPISWAAEHGREMIVKLLLETGQVDVNLKDQHGQTPLSWALKKGHKAVVTLLQSYSHSS